jgi:ABC-type ATPase with predicted acetyltransferase domain
VELKIEIASIDMGYESADRELESMNEFIEDNYDPDYGWIDVWHDEAAAIAYENRDQEFMEDILTEEMRIWTLKQ